MNKFEFEFEFEFVLNLKMLSSCGGS
jgi:hypothetical protein